MKIADRNLRQIAEATLDPRVGIFTQVVQMPLFPESANIYIYNATMVEAAYYSANKQPKVFSRPPCTGAAVDAESAIWAMFGEGFERYCASIYTKEEATFQANPSQKDLELLGKFIFFADQKYDTPGFQYQRFSETQARRWTLFEDALTRKKAWIPSQIVYLYFDALTQSEILFDSGSTGLACGPDTLNAVAGGALEIIERDAFISTWLLRISPPRIALDNDLLEALGSQYESLLGNEALEVNLFYLTNDLPGHVILCVIRSKGAPSCTFGASASLDLLTAIRKALVEVHHTRVWALTLNAQLEANDDIEFSGYDDHVRAYMKPSRQSAIKFLFNGKTVTLNEILKSETGLKFNAASKLKIGDRVEFIAKQLELKGYQLLFRDITTADVRQLGLNVVRTFIPGAQPLFCGADNEAFDRRRLNSIASHFGLSMPVRLNPEPHPFP
jgi:ribosomal protein S12 methylthiotransferase accessory factor